MKAVTYFISLGSKITVDSDYSCEKKKTLGPWKKSYDQPRQHIKKRDISLLSKGLTVKAMVFPVVMKGCEIWTMK